MAAAELIPFTDQDLKKLEASGKPTMIYVWSQDQIYSMKYWRWYEEAARRAGLKFVAVSKWPMVRNHDFDVHGMPQNIFSLTNQSDRLTATGATFHTPSVLIVENGQLLGRPIIGALKPKHLATAIERLRNGK